MEKEWSASDGTRNGKCGATPVASGRQRAACLPENLHAGAACVLPTRATPKVRRREAAWDTAADRAIA